MSKRPKLDHQQTTANDNDFFSEEISSEVHFEYTGTGDQVPDYVTHVRVHPSVTKIEDWSFYDRRRLKEVVLNEGLTVIGSNAFYNCTALERITLPSTVITITQYAFKRCTKLKEVVLNDGLTSIGSGEGRAFTQCSALQSITIPSTVKEICRFAFSYCTSLREVVLNEGLEKIGRNVFQSCKSLQSITIPSTVDDIGMSTCNECNNLRTIVLKEGIKRIKSYAFKDCTELRSITIPSTVTSIEKETFNGCTSLREVNLSDGIRTIGDNVFDDCPLLDRLIFASTSSRLGNILSAGQTDIEAKIDVIINDVVRAGAWNPFLRRGSELSIDTGIQARFSVNWPPIKQCLNRIVGLITYYEVREATTLFELALWKARIDQADVSMPSSNRGAYRVEVPGPVKDAILQYLWPGGGIGMQLSNALDGLLN